MKIDPRSGLTEEQVEKLQQKLLQTRDTILDRSRRRKPSSDDAASLAEPRGDAGDQAEIGFEQALQVELSERDRMLLQEINQTLDRIERGTYGTSELSGEPIGFERLSVQPWARTTQEEQEMLEEAAHTGPPPSM